MENVLVTGSTGEIGLALVQELLSQGIHVTAIVRPGSKRAERLPISAVVIPCELGKLQELTGIGGLSGPFDVFYHLGWDHSREHNDVDSQLINVDYTMRAIDAAAQLGCSCFVGAGSQAEYGRVDGIIEETTLCFPETAYGIAKLCAGQLSRIRCGQRGIRCLWPRIFSVYGPGDAESTMVISVIKCLLEGNVPALTKGEQMWDFLYASDCARALRLLGENNNCEGVYCIGYGKSQLLRHYIEEIRDNINKDLSLGFGMYPYSERQVMNLRVCIDKLERDTGFRPNVTFAEGIQRTIQWCRKNWQSTDI